MKKHIIWSNIDCGELKDWKKYFIEYLEINKITDIDPNDENALQKFMTNTNYMYLEDERDNLNKTIDGKILVIADLGVLEPYPYSATASSTVAISAKATTVFDNISTIIIQDIIISLKLIFFFMLKNPP